MKDIEGIDEAVRLIRPHMAEIDKRFEEENARFKALMAHDHGLIGRVLKCHLVVEHYLGRFIADHYQIADLDDVRLGFFQKAKLLPNGGQAAAFVKPGVLCLNSIRNRFGHSLDPALSLGDVGPMQEVIRVIRPLAHFDSPIDVIEAFTTIACTWLIVTPPHLQEIWTDVFSKIRVHTV